jgi:hypothetical protein
MVICLRTFIVILSFFCSLFLFGQTSKVKIDTVKITDLQKIKSIHDLLPTLPDGCRVELFDIIVNDGVVRICENQTGDTTLIKGVETKTGTGGNYNLWHSLIHRAKVGTNIYVDVKKFNCSKGIKKSYKFTVVK